MIELKDPAEYLAAYRRAKAVSPMVGPLRIVTHRNRHPDVRDGDWGWFEIFPLSVTVGHWSTYGTKDLDQATIDTWNTKAAALCK